MKLISFNVWIVWLWLAVVPMVFAQTESTPTDFGLSPFPLLYNTQLEFTPTPLDFPAEFGQFPQHIEILGVHVFATSSIPSETVLGYAATFANLIDSNQDGMADHEAVWIRLVEGRTALVLVSTSDPIITLHPILEAVGDASQFGQAYTLQPIFVTDVNLNTPPSDALFAMHGVSRRVRHERGKRVGGGVFNRPSQRALYALRVFACVRAQSLCAVGLAHRDE